MIFRKTYLLFLSTLFFTTAHAHEGMWLPHLLKQIEGPMQEMGMKMTAEDIFSVNKSSLKDAVLLFGGCTASIISKDALVLTNYHCAYGQIQSHSTLTQNYLANGFWAADKTKELPSNGLTVTLIRRIEDVTTMALAGVTAEMTEEERQSQIDKNIKAYEPQIKKEADEKHFIRPIYYGNQYLLYITLTYRDIRLVGTPPESIGKFGSDTDNWVWPRHTGDFALFRIYAGPDNRPANYSTDNVPYKPDHFLPVSMDGVSEGDFTLVFGFPGRTQQYLSASGLEMVQRSINPPRIAIRDTALQILDVAMRADAGIKLQYAAKYSSVANYWKKWIGENQGLEQTNAVEQKRNEELDLIEQLEYYPAYKNVLRDLDQLNTEITPFEVAAQYHNEIVLRHIEIFTPARILSTLAQRYAENGTAGYQDYLQKVLPGLEGFYKGYRADLDQLVFTALMWMYAAKGDRSRAHERIFNDFSGDRASSNTALLFGQSMLPQGESVTNLLRDSVAVVIATLAKDPMIRLYNILQEDYITRVAKPMAVLQRRIDTQMRLFMAAKMEIMPQESAYPDANGTLRVTYGKIEGYQPAGVPQYEAQTWLSGVVQKYIPGDYEFDVPARLLELEKNKDYGPYGEGDKMPVCFIGSNHTTNGNSGSPVIDAHGNLIGLNFDRVWEGTMSDLNFDPSICRNIMLDARYILFIIDKFAGARHIVDEMTLVHPKNG
jgi:hypothetical protein